MRAKTITACGLALALHIAAGATDAQVVEKKTLTLSGARTVAEIAAAEARKNKAGGAIAVVDDGGNLLYLERLDNTFAAAANISIAKARSAANFRRETSVFEDAVKNGRVSLVANPELLPLQGGVPIVIDGQVVGAIGVAGANSAQQDEDVARAAAQAFMAGGTAVSHEPVTELDAKTVEAAFAKGQPLFETDGYKIHASRREGPGLVEIHTRDTDIIYVLGGTATIVTGGQIVGGRTIADDEIRGTSIDGGQTRTLTTGDVMVIPNGVPHWFEQVQAPFL